MARKRPTEQPSGPSVVAPSTAAASVADEVVPPHSKRRRGATAATTENAPTPVASGSKPQKPPSSGPSKSARAPVHIHQGQSGRGAKRNARRRRGRNVLAEGEDPLPEMPGFVNGAAGLQSNPSAPISDDEPSPDSPSTTPEHIDLGTSDDIEPNATATARKLAKGKGRAIDADASVLSALPGPFVRSDATQASRGLTGREAAMNEDIRRLREENERMQKEIASKNELLLSQQTLIQTVRSSISCPVCMETLDSPYALACGHVSCHKCVYAWFHRPDPEAPQLEFASDEEALPVEVAASVQGRRRNRSPENAAGDGADQRARRAPPMLPDTRRKNLVCPQCRTPARLVAPAQIFALKEIADTMKNAQATGSGGVEMSPPLPPGGGLAEAHRDEKDKTWGGIFVEGAERRGREVFRAPHIMRDPEDGVRRCGLCNWEVDRGGYCAGCGAMFSDASDFSETDDDEDMEHSEDEGTRYATDEEEELEGEMAGFAGPGGGVQLIDIPSDDDASDGGSFIVSDGEDVQDHRAQAASSSADSDASESSSNLRSRGLPLDSHSSSGDAQASRESSVQPVPRRRAEGSRRQHRRQVVEESDLESESESESDASVDVARAQRRRERAAFGPDDFINDDSDSGEEEEDASGSGSEPEDDQGSTGVVDGSEEDDEQAESEEEVHPPRHTRSSRRSRSGRSDRVQKEVFEEEVEGEEEEEEASPPPPASTSMGRRPAWRRRRHIAPASDE